VRRRYLGKPAEERAAERRRRLRDAAFVRLAETPGWHDVTIGSLCNDAGLNKRYFYESFGDLDEVAGAVVDDLAGELLALASAAATGGNDRGLAVADLARTVLTATVTWLAEDPRRATVLFAASADHPNARAHRRAVVQLLASALTTFAYGYHGSSMDEAVDGARAEAIAQVGSAMFIGGTVEAVLQWLDDPTKLAIDELVDYLAELWVAIGDRAVTLATRDDDAT